MIENIGKTQQISVRNSENSVHNRNLSDNNIKPFSKVLEEKFDGTVTFSKHAIKRINSRKIEIEEKQIIQFKEVMRKLEQKGARESLILMQDRERENLAFVVNVKNKTVVTALTESMMKENIFTNIDSTVVIKK